MNAPSDRDAPAPGSPPDSRCSEVPKSSAFFDFLKGASIPLKDQLILLQSLP
jgi:hypothetical protein